MKMRLSGDGGGALAATALAMLFGVLALYGCWSTPALVARWGASAAGLLLFAGWGAVAGWATAVAVRAPRRSEWIVFAIMVASMRFASLMLAAGRVSPGDPQMYLDLAQHLIAGEGLFLDDPAMRVRAYAEFPPAYPLLLAGWGAAFGLSVGSILLLSTALDLAAAALITAIGTRLGERRAGRAAAALYLIWPSTLLAAPLAQKESLELLLALALAHGWLAAATRPRSTAAVAVGVTAGLLALTQPGVAALAALFGLAVAPAMGWRRFVRVATPAAGVAALVMLPWWWRNWHVLHAVVPLTSVGGLSLWIGENPDATGNWMPYPAALTGLPEIETARRAGAMAVDWMTAHPGGALRLNLAKFVRAVGIGQAEIVRLDAMRPTVAPAATAALLPLTQGAHLLLLGAGAASLLARRQRTTVLLLLAVVAQLALFGVWFEFGERHRAVLTPFLLLSIAMSARAMAPARWIRLRRVRAAASWGRPAA